jgi:hypothetical protein
MTVRVSSLPALTAALVFSLACNRTGAPPVKALVGGIAIDPQGATISDSVVLIGGSRINAIGKRADSPAPASAERWNAKDRWIIPAPIRRGEGLLLPRFDSMAEVRVAMIRPPPVVEGLPTDVDAIPVDVLQRFAQADTIFVPRLARLESTPERLTRAVRMIGQLREARIRVAAFAGDDALAEWRLLAGAGFTARQVLEAATVHAARAARIQEDNGALRTGYLANLWILSADPLADVANLSKVESILLEGEWMRTRGSSSN